MSGCSEALSLALNRQAIIANVYKGAALVPHWLSNPGVFGYGKAVFDKAYNSSPLMSYNLAKAKKLVKEAGATGKTFTIGTSQQIANIAAVTGAYQAAANAIGLKTVLHSVSAQNYINFFIDPKARAGVDGFLTVNYGDYADPAALLSTLGHPRRVAELRQLQRQADPNWLESGPFDRQPGRQGGAGRQGRGARGASCWFGSPTRSRRTC